MGIVQNAALRVLKSCRSKTVSALGVAAVALSVAGAAQPVLAQTSGQFSALVINNDRGGLLRARIAQLASLRQTGQPVRITGGICYSTCTMFIGLPQTCISPNTVFGFHGPSSYGRSLDPATFNTASRVISQNYPPALRSWYMIDARFSINSVRRVRGSQLIDMGVRAC